MSENAVLEVLRGVHFLEGVAEEHLERLAELAEVVEFDEGILIFREGDPASTIYLIVKGNVSLEICAPGIGCRRIFTAGAGDLLGRRPRRRPGSRRWHRWPRSSAGRQPAPKPREPAPPPGHRRDRRR